MKPQDPERSLDLSSDAGDNALFHIPADRELELALLGAVLLEPPVMDQLDFLVPGDFFFPQHQELFRRMRMLFADTPHFDLVLITDGDLELLAICNEAFTSCPTSLLALSYARKIKELAQKRRYIKTAQTIVDYAMNGRTPEEIADFLMAEVQSQTANSSDNPFERWQTQGITAADAAAAGKVERHYLVQDVIREKSVTCFFGPPGEFKSALTMDLALCIANGVP